MPWTSAKLHGSRQKLDLHYCACHTTKIKMFHGAESDAVRDANVLHKTLQDQWRRAGAVYLFQKRQKMEHHHCACIAVPCQESHNHAVTYNACDKVFQTGVAEQHVMKRSISTQDKGSILTCDEQEHLALDC